MTCTTEMLPPESDFYAGNDGYRFYVVDYAVRVSGCLHVEC